MDAEADGDCLLLLARLFRLLDRVRVLKGFTVNCVWVATRIAKCCMYRYRSLRMRARRACEKFTINSRAITESHSCTTRTAS